MAIKKFLPNLQMKFREPFKTALCPWNGPNGILNLDEMDCVDVEIRGQGNGIFKQVPAEYMDIRVYLIEKKKESHLTDGVADGSSSPTSQPETNRS